jgi:hypothetical protein
VHRIHDSIISMDVSNLKEKKLEDAKSDQQYVQAKEAL